MAVCLHHFTGVDRLIPIFDDQRIRGSSIRDDNGVVSFDGVWLSTRRIWEPACRAAADLEPSGLRAGGKVEPGFVPEGGARLLVMTHDARPWDEVLREKGVGELSIFRYAQCGLMLGSNPEHWFIRPGVVSLEEIVKVEVFEAAEWKTCSIYTGKVF